MQLADAKTHKMKNNVGFYKYTTSDFENIFDFFNFKNRYFEKNDNKIQYCMKRQNPWIHVRDVVMNYTRVEDQNDNNVFLSFLAVIEKAVNAFFTFWVGL